MLVLLAAHKHFFNSGSTRCTFKGREKASPSAVVLQFELTTKSSITTMLELLSVTLKDLEIKLSQTSLLTVCVTLKTSQPSVYRDNNLDVMRRFFCGLFSLAKSSYTST